MALRMDPDWASPVTTLPLALHELQPLGGPMVDAGAGM